MKVLKFCSHCCKEYSRCAFIQQVRGGGAAQRVGVPTLAMECEK